MTIRRRKNTEETSEPGLIQGMTATLGSANTTRALIFMLVLSMHPFGRALLSAVGVKFPDEQKLVVATEKTADADKKLASLTEDVKDLKDSMTRDRAERAITNAKLDDLGKTLNGFKIDLEQFRQHVDFKANTPSKP